MKVVKRWIGKIHLWLGLLIGLFVFIIAITGCIYAFQVEIGDLIEPYRFTSQWGEKPLPPSRLGEKAQAVMGTKHAHSVIYRQGGRSAQVVYYSVKPEYYDIVYLDPYSGDVLKVKDMNADFFRFILDGHFYLWLPPDIGQPVVATVTLIFVGMLITGIYLWWPRNKAATKQRFTIKWNVRWRRKNYDLHNVLGFYSSWIAIILALTGLVWGFEWFAQTVYTVAGGGGKIPPYEEPVSDSTAIRSVHDRPVVDRIWDKMNREHPNADLIEVHYPETPGSAIGTSANPDAGTYWKADYRYFDQYTMAELKGHKIYGRFDSTSTAGKIMRMNYDLHVGAIFGFAGKLLMFCVSLIVASLPITGTIVWYGRRKKIAALSVRPIATEKKSMSGQSVLSP